MPTPILFDLYQRYRFIKHLISILNPNKTDRILEVGSFGSPLRKLLSDHPIVMLDRHSKLGEIDIQANGLHLPFSDRSFEIVISTDALEHMISCDRIPFIRELARVTSGVVILGFPHADPQNAKADKILIEFIDRYSDGKFQHVKEYLNEHSGYGLPDATEIQHKIREFMPEILQFKNSNVYSWLLFQLGNFALLNQPKLENVRILLNDFFNDTLEFMSHDPPCYRTFFVCSRAPLQHEVLTRLQESRERQNLSPAKDIAAELLALVSASEAAIRESNHQLAMLKEQKEKLETQVDDLKSTIRSQTLVNQNLEAYLNLFFQHPAYRIYKFLKISFQRLLKNHNSGTADIAYLLYQNTFEPDAEDWKRQSREWQQWQYTPTLNIVTAVFGPDLKIFQETVDSVLRQTYGRWVWNVVDASKGNTTWKLIMDLSASDSRVRPYRLEQNKGISENMNVALQQATGDYIVVLDHDDTLVPHALFAVAQAIANNPDLDFIYSDADKLDEFGNRCEPLFKPDWSPEMMLSWNLLNQISVFRRSLLDRVGYLNPELDGAQDWDLYFRITEQTQRIHHIPQILYHWRKTPHSTARSMGNKPFAKKAQILAIANHLKRTGIRTPHVFFIPRHPIHRTYPVSRWKVTNDWKVSIIIPSKDRANLLKKCLESLFQLTTYPNYEVVVVDTGSTEERTSRYYDLLKTEPRFRVVSLQEPFNFGKTCNTGASHATGEFFLFLNNDTQVLDGGWLELMLQWFERSGVGVVGAKLLYPNGKIQHAGVILGFGGLAGHLFANENENTSGIFGTDCWYRNLSAVTGACLMIPRELFSRVSGFDETFQLIYSDVELCMRVAALGFRTVYSPDVRLIHHESATHERHFPRVDFENASRKWRAELEKGDPYYNPNLTSTSARPAFKLRPDETLVQLNDSLMDRLPEKEIIRLPGDVL